MLKLNSRDFLEVSVKLSLITAINMAFLNNEWYPKKVAGKWITYCNKSVRFICQQLGIELPPTYALANDICDYLDGPYSSDWEEISYEDGFAEAKKGNIVIAGQKGSPNGHVAILYPADDMQYSGTFGGLVPIVFNMGLTVGIVKLSFAFKSSVKPKLYIYKGTKRRCYEKNS